jgi:beta-lactamase regulating signal transducer with metallopeptidase domain
LNSSDFLEALTSLTLQVTLLIGVAAWSTRKNILKSYSDTLWAIMHICILALTCIGLLTPHLRLFTWADLQPLPNHSFAEVVSSSAGEIAAWIWASGSILVAVACIGGIVRATQLIRNAKMDRPFSQSLGHLLSEFAAESIEIRFLPDRFGPFCWQIHRPIIVLPEMVRTFPAVEQAAIMRHELAHLRLQHPLHLFFQRFVEAIYWFHPLVWWASKQAAAAREFRCDREAVSSDGDVVNYLQSLLRLIEAHVRAPGRLPAGLGFLGSSSLLAERANLLTDHAETATRSTWRLTALCLFAVATWALVWLPVNPTASRRARWSPWPSWSARAIESIGLAVRDYEVDGHRLKADHLR